MSWFNKMQKRFDPLGYKLRKADPIRKALFGPLEGGGDNPAAVSTPLAPMGPYTGFGQQQAPMQQPMGPQRAMVGAPRQMGRRWVFSRDNRWVSHSPWVNRVRRGHWLVLHVFNNKQRSTHFARRRLLCSSG